MTNKVAIRSKFAGVLLGIAVGDALGLPAENLSPERIQKLWHGDWRMRFLFGRGMISDDTEHTLFVAQALLTEPEDASKFQRALARRLKWWFAALPGGVGLATAKACLRMWVGFPITKCAVASAGSGPAMRSAIIGAYFAHDAQRRRAFTLASSRLTHRSWQAETAALAIAEAAALAIRKSETPEPFELIELLRPLSSEEEWQTWLSRINSGLAAGTTVAEFACQAGLPNGITGYSLHVAPIALYSWMRHPGDFNTALTVALNCGGDTDTVGAVLGGIAGSTLGLEGIPQKWSANLADWPRTKAFMLSVAERLAEQSVFGKTLGPVRYFWPGIIPRNLLFIAVVLLHGFRRLLPPW